MSYIPTNWKNGDVITSQRLNKIENGISESIKNLPVLILTEESVGQYNIEMVQSGFTMDQLIDLIKNGYFLSVIKNSSDTSQKYYILTQRHKISESKFSLNFSSGNSSFVLILQNESISIVQP